MDWPIGLKRRSNASRAPRVFNYPITQSPNYPIQCSPSGFTIIELLVVLALISILATMGMAQYRQGVVHAREAVLKTDLFDLRDAIDPFTNTADTWQTIPSEPDPNNPTATPGIYDVKSGSEQTAIDGSKYAEW